MSKVKEMKETPEERQARLEAKVDRLQAQQRSNGNGHEPFEGFDEDEVTDVIDIALKKLERGAEAVHATVHKAATEVAAACRTPQRARR